MQENLPQECYFEALKSAKVWLQYSTSTFFPYEPFIHNLSNLLSNETVQLKVMSIFKRMLVKSKYAKILENASFATAFSQIPQKDLSFLHMIV